MFRGKNLPEVKTARTAVTGDYEAWNSLALWETSGDLSVPVREHQDASNYAYICFDALNRTGDVPAPAMRFGELIRNNSVTVDGFLTRGVAAGTDTPIVAAEKYAEYLESRDRQEFLSFTRTPRVAYAFSTGIRKIHASDHGWSRACHRGGKLGFLVVVDGISGFHLSYDKNSIGDDRRLEAEVIVSDRLSVTDVLTGRQSVFGVPTVVCTKG